MRTAAVLALAALLAACAAAPSQSEPEYRRDQAAIGLLNAAAGLHRAGDLDAAREHLASLLALQPPAPPEYAGRAEARLALIELQSDGLDAAAAHAERARALCPSAGCPWRIALGNVEAAIALQRGDAAGAEKRARATLAAAIAAKDFREETNARRLLAEIAAVRGSVRGAK